MSDSEKGLSQKLTKSLIRTVKKEDNTYDVPKIDPINKSTFPDNIIIKQENLNKFFVKIETNGNHQKKKNVKSQSYDKNGEISSRSIHISNRSISSIEINSEKDWKNNEKNAFLSHFENKWFTNQKFHKRAQSSSFSLGKHDICKTVMAGKVIKLFDEYIDIMKNPEKRIKFSRDDLINIAINNIDKNVEIGDDLKHDHIEKETAINPEANKIKTEENQLINQNQIKIKTEDLLNNTKPASKSPTRRNGGNFTCFEDYFIIRFYRQKMEYWKKNCIEALNNRRSEAGVSSRLKKLLNLDPEELNKLVVFVENNIGEAYEYKLSLNTNHTKILDFKKIFCDIFECYQSAFEKFPFLQKPIDHFESKKLEVMNKMPNYKKEEHQVLNKVEYFQGYDQIRKVVESKNIHLDEGQVLPKSLPSLSKTIEEAILKNRGNPLLTAAWNNDKKKEVKQQNEAKIQFNTPSSVFDREIKLMEIRMKQKDLLSQIVNLFAADYGLDFNQTFVRMMKENTESLSISQITSFLLKSNGNVCL